VLGHRGPKAALDPLRAYAALWEEEPDEQGVLVPTATVFLTNRECPFRCVMCDLWVNTLDGTVAPGAIPAQIARALEQLPPARHLKLYNAGSFFDPQAVPPGDDEAIARLASQFERVIVEAHPAFLEGAYGERCLRFNALLDGTLEVAVGLETAHPVALERLNKRMTLESFRRASAFLERHDIALRVFLLLNPPFVAAHEQFAWVCRSIDEAAACGAGACSIIPMRGGNGALEALGGATAPAQLRALEAAVEYGLSLQRLRVFADEWDLGRFFDCSCSSLRGARLRAMNRAQQIPPCIACDACADGGRRLVTSTDADRVRRL
jgi:hypothetical protein